MKFSCEKNLLQEAVTTASRASALKSAVPALEGLLIEADNDTVKISGYDLKTGITTKLNADTPDPGSIVINARLFGEIIRKLPENFVSIETDNNLMTTITCGMSNFQILGSSPVDYPELPAVDYQNSMIVSEKLLKNMISQTIFAVSDNESRPIHTGALFEVENGVMTVVAVDGYRLALRREPLENTVENNFNFVVPGTALNEVEKIASDSDKTITIMLGSKHIMFTIGETTLISRRLEGEFLNYKNSIPKTFKYSIAAERQKIVEAVERVSLIINEKQKSPVRCTFGDGTLKVLSITALGRASDECAIEGDGDNLEIGFNNRFLLEALKAAPADKIVLQLSSGVSPCIVMPADESQNFLYMILPVRLKANES